MIVEGPAVVGPHLSPCQVLLHRRSPLEGRRLQAERLEYSGPAYDAAPGRTGVTRSTGPGGTGVQTGAPQHRNDDCACGSGKKYKRCHGDPRNA